MYGVSKLRRACWGYIGKVSQLFELQKNLSPDQLFIVDYDDLVIHKEVMLPLLYDFIDLPFKQEYAERIHSKSVSKIAKLSRRESSTIKSLCVPIYQAASTLRTQQLCEHSVKSDKSEATDHIGEVEGQP
jgi:hypothetical protein